MCDWGEEGVDVSDNNDLSGSRDEAVLNVEVAYAMPDRQKIVAIQVKPGCTLYEAAEQSGIVDLFPEIDLETAAMGVFGKAERQPKQRPIQAGDRVEIYRPLLADPKEVRKKRAAKAKAEKAANKTG